MTYREFCTQIVPMVNELQEECRKMEPEEFRKFRQELMEALKCYTNVVTGVANKI